MRVSAMSAAATVFILVFSAILESWSLEGVDLSNHAVDMAEHKGLEIHRGFVEEVDLPEASYDLILLIATIEHVADPRGILATIHGLLRPGGRLVIVTDNTGTLDFRIFKHRHWGGYHFPRHWNLFNFANLGAWLVNRFSLKSTGSLAVFTIFDSIHQMAGWGLYCAPC